MYTLLIRNDNTVVATETCRLIQRSKLVDTLRVLAPQTYNDYDMSDFMLIMEYITPISRQHNYEELVRNEELYQNDYLEYTLPIDTKLTVENGDIEVALTFMGNFMDEDGVAKERVRKLDPVKIHIIAAEDWLHVPDAALDTLTQYILAGQQLIKANSDIQATLMQTKADSIKLDIDTEELYLTAQGKKVGDAIPLDSLGDEITEATQDGLVKTNIQR